MSSIYRLSGLQEGMLFHGLYDGQAGTYVIQLEGELLRLAEAIFRRSWGEVVRRHSILRSGFYYNEFKVLVQCVYREVEVPMEILDYRGRSEAEQREGMAAYKEADRRRGFAFGEAPLMRVGLMRLSEERYWMLWTHHHLLLDGWSVQVLMEEFLTVYEELVTGVEEQEQEEDRYEEYIRYLEGRDKEDEEGYWREYLSGVCGRTLLPFVREGVERNKGIGEYGEWEVRLGKEGTERVVGYAQGHRLTVNTVMQGVWGYLLSRYTGSEEVVYGVTVSGRPEGMRGVERRVGLYINMLPVRVVVKGEEEVKDWLRGLQEEQLRSREYQYSPLQAVQGWAGVTGDWFDSILVFENYPVSEVIGKRKWSLGVEGVKMHDRINYPLGVTIRVGEQIAVTFRYNVELLGEEVVKRIGVHFERVLQQVTGGEVKRVRELELMGEEEVRWLLEASRGKEVEYNRNKTVVELFEEQVDRTPGAVAVVCGGQKVSYRELEERSNQLAHYLRGLGIREEVLVPVCLERSVEMIVGILGILKAGGAYVPLDPEYPAERLEYILEETEAKVAVSRQKVAAKLPISEGVRVVLVDEEAAFIDERPVGRVERSLRPEHLAYVIYTSGSTGRPKGVLVEHHSLTNYLINGQTSYIENEEGGSYIYLPYTFDAALTGLFQPLVYGRSLVIGEGGATEVFSAAIFRSNTPYCFIKLTPAHLQLLEAAMGEGVELPARRLVVGGEVLSWSQLEWLRERGMELEVVNEYGPTEATVGCSVYRYQIGEEKGKGGVPIGKPIDNSSIYILDREGMPAPMGVGGELYIGGAGVARGYLNRPELTAERFVESPFGEGERLYRTGDLGRWLLDGNMEYLGRIDEQVKIRGYRIELGEIENVLEESGLVRQGVVVAREDKEGNKRLVGYVVVSEGYDKGVLIKYLQGWLPEYMVPGVWVELKAMPLTVNGKVDRKGLPEPCREKYVAPRSEIERQLAAIWSELLGVEQVGVEDSFFELGGHSLLAFRLVSAVRQELGVELPIREVFDYPTIGSLGSRLKKGPVLPPVVATTRPERLPLSYSQERLWFIDQLEGSVAYHTPVVLRLKGKLSEEGLSYAIGAIVDRHEVLRTVIEKGEGRAYQRVLEKGGWKLEVIGEKDWKEEVLRGYIEQEISRQFDLSVDYPVRGQLLRVRAGEWVLVVTLHHIASDGWSNEILEREFVELYRSYVEGRAAVLPALEVQYADYALWQRGYLSGEVMEEKLRYWRDQLSGMTALELPTDHVRPAVLSRRGGLVGFRIASEVRDALEELSRSERVTIFMLLLAVFKVLLSRYCGQEDISVGSPIAGRQQREVEGLIGFFANTLVLRSDLSGEPSFRELLKRVKETTLRAYEHQEVPFEKVVEAVARKRDIGKNPLVEVIFVLQNREQGKIEEKQIEGLEFAKEKVGLGLSKSDLAFRITEDALGLDGLVEYCSELYEEETIRRLIGHYKELLRSVVRDAGERIGKLRMMSDEENRRVLEEFNATAVDYPRDKTVVELIGEQAERSPEAIAVAYGLQRVSYRELEERSNQLGHYLRGLGVREEVLVPVCLERSVEMIVGILGVLKAGGAYVPLDPEYPTGRLAYMLEDVQGRVVVSSREVAARLPVSGAVRVVLLDEERAEIDRCSLRRVEQSLRPERLAYVIYTSGSTGQPKGVMIEHGSLLNLSLAQPRLIHLTSRDNVLQFASITFDASCWEIFPALVTGSRLVIPGKADILSAELLLQKITEEEITMVTLPSSYLEIIGTSRVPIGTIISAGEALSYTVAQRVQEAGIRLINAYGPTESTVCATLTEAPVLGNKLISIGKPIDNIRIYIIDDRMNLVPVGIKGEICIGGVGLARGYWRRPDLTAERFVDNPFQAGERMYRTGDIGRWLPDGNIEFIGRKDNQVKIRGYRVELGEVESVLGQCAGVRQGVVAARKDKEGDKQLVGYVVVEAGWVKERMMEELEGRLPEYMVPGKWVELEALPLTVNGKVDRKELPEPEASRERYVAPRSEIERQLVAIWSELLDVEQVGVEDNFFELGGHSLLAIRLVSAVRQELGVELTIMGVFDYPTIRLMARHIRIHILNRLDDFDDYESVTI
ncbi:non-ribosomal peptide synthetase [Puia dinghuensis]|uniref:non-ribosomal peptide synthetase n=1 Tax=Puia dinghuensis TaxID=1792502 RepID=UPI00166E1C2E|nr:non-ribosomal peptide synthetase [Puia dinghuensis]